MYSQHGEDELLACVLPDTGRFLDIGAFHPRNLSNTRLLYERGWGGLMVEPSPGPMRRLIDAYGYDSRVTLLQAAIGVQRGVVPMEVTDGPVSTSDALVRQIWAGNGHYVGRVFVPVLTIEDVISQFGPFDFVSIDAEGHSVEIFERLIVNPMHAKCVCVEYDGEQVAVERMAAEAGYQHLGTNETNAVFLR